MRALVKRGRQLADWVILERKMYTILTVEDDLHINNLLREALGKAGYACSQAFSGTEALLWLEHNECQLILLDLMLPGLSGEEVLQQIRQTSNVPVIVLTAKGEMEEKLDLLTSGADDYMTKPFDVKEVIARVQIQLRHLQHGAGEESTHLKCRGMDLDKETHRVMIDGQELGHLSGRNLQFWNCYWNIQGRYLVKRQCLLMLGRRSIWGKQKHWMFISAIFAKRLRKLQSRNIYKQYGESVIVWSRIYKSLLFLYYFLAIYSEMAVMIVYVKQERAQKG